MGGLCSPTGTCLLRLPLTRHHPGHAETSCRQKKVLCSLPTPCLPHILVWTRSRVWREQAANSKSINSGKCRWVCWCFHRFFHLPWCRGLSPGVCSMLLMLYWNQPEACWEGNGLWLSPWGSSCFILSSCCPIPICKQWIKMTSSTSQLDRLLLQRNRFPPFFFFSFSSVLSTYTLIALFTLIWYFLSVILDSHPNSHVEELHWRSWAKVKGRHGKG